MASSALESARIVVAQLPRHEQLQLVRESWQQLIRELPDVTDEATAVLDELEQLGVQIAATWTTSATSAELVSAMRR
jgi:Tfp pilus assembly protein PilO